MFIFAISVAFERAGCFFPGEEGRGVVFVGGEFERGGEGEGGGVEVCPAAEDGNECLLGI